MHAFILEQGGSFSVTSMRMDLVNEAFIELLRRSGHQTITLAPETGSERLREVIHKGLTDEQIVRTIELMSAYRFRHLKLYFLIGLPTETASDIAAISELTKKIQHLLLKSRSAPIPIPRNDNLEHQCLYSQTGHTLSVASLRGDPLRLQAKLKQIKNSLKR